MTHNSSLAHCEAVTKAGGGSIPSFNGRLRDECLNEYVFSSLGEARTIIETWRHDYNQLRPHSSLGYLAPQEFAAQWTETAATAPEPVPAQSGKPETGNSLETLT